MVWTLDDPNQEVWESERARYMKPSMEKLQLVEENKEVVVEKKEEGQILLSEELPSLIKEEEGVMT